MVFVPLFLFVFLLFRFRLRAEIGLPVILRPGWKLIQVREEHGYLPHVVGAECLIPRRHARVANPSADGIEDVPVGIVRWIGYEIRWRRIEGCSERRGFAVKGSVTE